MVTIEMTGHERCALDGRTLVKTTLVKTTLDNSIALDHFLASVERRAYRMAMIATNCREDALDIVQDAMLRLAKRYGARDPEQWGPLFHRIVQSVIRDWYRRTAVRNRFRFFFGQTASSERGHEAEADENHLETRFAAQQPEPDAHLVQQQAITQLEAALHGLPLRQQQAFLLRQWEGLSVRDTAQAMGCGEGSVKTHFSRAVKALREQLQDHWPETESPATEGAVMAGSMNPSLESEA